MTDPADLTLRRYLYGESCTLGFLRAPGLFAYTIERPWLDNRPSESCIPDGLYECRPRYFHHGGYDAIEVCDVPGRSDILFHKANVSTDVRGCIAPGTTIGILAGQVAVLNSAGAFAALMALFQGKVFRLLILPVDPLLMGARLQPSEASA